MRGLCADDAVKHILDGTYAHGQANWLISNVIHDPVALVKLAAATKEESVAIRCVQKLNDENLSVRLFCTFLSTSLMGACIPYINARLNLDHCIRTCLPKLKHVNFSSYTKNIDYSPYIKKIIAKLDDRTLLKSYKEDPAITPELLIVINKRLEELPNAIDFIRY